MASASLILASCSPCREALLSLFGLPFRIQPAEVHEYRLENESPSDMTRRLARMKVDAIATLDAKTWVLGGDTTVSIHDDCLGKPKDRADAIRMLERLSDACHDVISAVALVGPGFAEVAVSQTQVEFIPLSREVISRYCDTDEPYDKAGAYGIQGVGGTFVRGVRGSYSGVVGLPLYETRLLLECAGLIPASAPAGGPRGQRGTGRP